MGVQSGRRNKEVQIMENPKKSNSCNKEITLYIIGVIELILSAFVTVTCVISTFDVVDIRGIIQSSTHDDSFNDSKIKTNDTWLIQLNFVNDWLKWIIVAIGLFSFFKLMANGLLMYGITQRISTFVKCWLIFGFVEMFLIFWACILEFFVFIYTSGIEKTSVNVAYPIMIVVISFIFMFAKYWLWHEISKLHKGLKEEQLEEKAWNRGFAYSLHQKEIQIEKANGKYMKI